MEYLSESFHLETQTSRQYCFKKAGRLEVYSLSYTQQKSQE